MNTRALLIATAVIELPAGVALLIAPSRVAELLLGAGLGSLAGALVGRVAGAALVTIGLSCWLERNRERSVPRSGLVLGLLAYNSAVPLFLSQAAVADKMSGIALWPACGLHTVLAIWCAACLRSRRP